LLGRLRSHFPEYSLYLLLWLAVPPLALLLLKEQGFLAFSFSWLGLTVYELTHLQDEKRFAFRGLRYLKQILTSEIGNRAGAIYYIVASLLAISWLADAIFLGSVVIAVTASVYLIGIALSLEIESIIEFSERRSPIEYLISAQTPNLTLLLSKTPERTCSELTWDNSDDTRLRPLLAVPILLKAIAEYNEGIDPRELVLVIPRDTLLNIKARLGTEDFQKTWKIIKEKYETFIRQCSKNLNVRWIELEDVDSWEVLKLRKAILKELENTYDSPLSLLFDRVAFNISTGTSTITAALAYLALKGNARVAYLRQDYESPNEAGSYLNFVHIENIRVLDLDDLEAEF